MSASTAERVAERIQPFAGEDQPSFAVRFHASMTSGIPDTRQRNDAMLAAWQKHDPLVEDAESQFPVERYHRIGAVAEFAEHTATHDDGTQTRYGRDQLAAICRNLNHRIGDTGNYGSLTDGHTPEDPHGKQPAVIGHVGPWYLGMIGQKRPRWALFATEHIRRDRLSRANELRHRSSEVWKYARVEDRLIDPVAAISDTPRLDMGMVRYSRRDDGCLVEKYSAAAMPGAFNSFVSSDRYSDDAGTAPEIDEMSDLSDADVHRIAQKAVEGVMAMPEFQYIRSQMQGGDGDPSDDPADGGAEDDDINSADGDVTDAPEEPADPDPVDEPEADPDSEPEATPEPEAAPSAPDPTPEPTADADTDSADDAVASLTARVAHLEQLLEKAGGEKRDLYRRQQLTEMRHMGVQVDVDKELELTADFNDVQFDRYARALPGTRARVPLAHVAQLPEGHDPDPAPVNGSDPKMERYSKSAREHCLRERRAGRACEFRDALQLAVSGQLPS